MSVLECRTNIFSNFINADKLSVYQSAESTQARKGSMGSCSCFPSGWILLQIAAQHLQLAVYRLQANGHCTGSAGPPTAANARYLAPGCGVQSLQRYSAPLTAVA